LVTTASALPQAGLPQLSVASNVPSSAPRSSAQSGVPRWPRPILLLRALRTESTLRFCPSRHPPHAIVMFHSSRLATHISAAQAASLVSEPLVPAFSHPFLGAPLSVSSSSSALHYRPLLLSSSS
jgi:hypothetical protein